MLKLKKTRAFFHPISQSTPPSLWVALLLQLATSIPTAVAADIHVLVSADGRGGIEPGISDHTSVPLGGLAQRATAIEQERSTHPETLLLEAGSFLCGTHGTGITSKSIADAYRILAYDAVNLGISDFRFGKAFTLQLLNDAKLPVVSANLYDKPNGKRIFPPYAIVEKSGRKVAILGLTEPPLTRSLLPHLESQLEGIYLQPLEQAMTDILPEVQGKADVIIVLYAGSAAGLQHIRTLATAGVEIIASAGPGPVVTTREGQTPVLLSPLPHGRELARGVLAGRSPSHPLPSLLITPGLKPHSGVQSALQSHLAATPHATDAVPRVPAPELVSLIPSALPAQPERNHLYRLQGSMHNRGADIDLFAAGLFDRFGSLQANEGKQLLVIRSEWENTIPLVLVQNQGLATEYRFPNLGDHLYVVVNGSTLSRLSSGKESIPGQLPATPLSLSYIGMREQGNLVYEVPAGTGIDSIQLRLYDYAHGHATYDLLGNPATPQQPLFPSVANEVVDAAVFSFTTSDTIGNTRAEPGTTFVSVDLRATSRFMFEADAMAFDPHARKGSKIKIGTVSDWTEAEQYNHLVVDGKYAFRPRSDLSMLDAEPRFLPDLRTGGRVVYQIPATFESLAIRADFPNAKLPSGKVIRPQPIVLPLTGTAPNTPTPNEGQALWQVSDDTLRVSIVAQKAADHFAGVKADAGRAYLVLDVEVFNQGQKPEFFQTDKQLSLVASDGGQSAPDGVTYQGILRPYENVWIPNGEHRCFQVVFQIDAGASENTLSYRGFTLAENFKLTSSGATVLATSTAEAGDLAVQEQTSAPGGMDAPTEDEAKTSEAPDELTAVEEPAAPDEEETPMERIQLAAFKDFTPEASLKDTLSSIETTANVLKNTPFLSLNQPSFQEFGSSFGPIRTVPNEDQPIPLAFAKPIETTVSKDRKAAFTLSVPVNLAKQGRVHVYVANATDSDKKGVRLYASIRGADSSHTAINRDAVSVAVTDLQLLAVEHTLTIEHSENRDVPIRIVAIEEEPVTGREAEDNGDRESPLLRLRAGEILSGRLFPGDDDDFFRWQVSEADAQRRWNLHLVADPTGVAAQVYLNTPEDEELKHARGSAGTALVLADLSPPPGDYVIRITPQSNNQPCAYHLLLEDAGPMKAGWEREPNDERVPAMLQVIQPGAHETTTLHGRFFGGDKDHFIVDITEPDRVYTMSLHGTGAQRMAYLDAEGRTLRASRATRNQKAALVDLRLPLGRNLFVVEGNASDYIVGIEAFPTPGAYFEIEPNDDRQRAHRIELESEYQGRLIDSQDTDCFRFVVQQAMPYRIVLDVPEGEAVRYSLYEDDNRVFSGNTADEESKLDEVFLYPGNHFFELRAVKPFLAPYRLQVQALHPAGVANGTIICSADEKPVVAAAYLDRFQQFELPLTLRNASNAVIEARIPCWSSNYQVQLRSIEPTVTLQPQQEKTITLRGIIESDAASHGPVSLFVAALGQNQETLGTWKGQLLLDPNGAALPAAASAGRIHPSLAGGLNVAAIDLGALPQEPEKDRVERLFDSVLSSRVFSGALAQVQLAGGGQVPLVGASFDLHGISRLAYGLKDYRIEVSDDGDSFREVARGQLLAKPGNQDVLFATEVKARYARLHLLNNQSGSEDEPELGEWRMLAKPGLSLPEYPSIDLLREDWGGHEIWRSESAVVYGFHHNRAGRIEAFEWRNKQPSTRNRENPKQITLAVSVSSPAGPWQEIGTFDVSAADAAPLKQRVEFPAAPWARFVKVSNPEGELPESHPVPGVFERTGDPSYRSLLGEWGGPVQESGYELQHPKTVRTAWERIESTVSKPARLDGDNWVESTVWINEGWEDWFTVEAPSDKQRLSIEVEGDPFVRVALEAGDGSGKPVTLVPHATSPGKRVWSLPVGAEGTYRFRVYEPMRSVVFIWDMSGSMSNFLDGIASAVVHFAQEVNPKTERVQLLPLEEPATFLLKDWESNPYMLSDTVRNFTPPSSSYAHLSLLEASKLLEKEPGTRAAIVIADCETSREVNPSLWQSLEQVQPIVYTFHTTDVTRSFGVEQDDMQDWAAVGGGRYYLIQDPYQLDHAFGKLQSQLRRPAGYRIRTTKATLQKASIELLDNRKPESIEDPFDNGFLLILDMSASMRTVMPDGVTLRSQAAMEGLTRIIEQLPVGTQLGVRVFGHRGGADCVSTLLVPVSPLDKSKTIEALRSIRVSSLGNTAIAEALDRAPEDLTAVSGKRHIILLTDGEETCRGDPEAAIANLTVAGVDTKVSIVGFMLEDAALQQKYQNWIGATGGTYYPATDSGSLEQVLRNAMTATPAPTVEILDSKGKVVTRAQVGTGPIELESGYYHIRTEDGDTTRFGLIKAIEKAIRLDYYPESED